MEEKINYRDTARCMNLSYKDMMGMEIDDAIFVLQEWIDRYHEAELTAKSIEDMMWLPRPLLIRAYEIAVECMQEIREARESKDDGKSGNNFRGGK